MLISSQIWSSIPTIGKIKQENTYQLSEAITNCAAELKFNKGKSKSIELAFDFFESYNFSDGATYVDATKTNAEEIYKTLCLDYNVGLIEGINYDAVAHFNGILYKVPSNKWFGEDADSFEGFNLQSPFKFVYIPLDNVNYRKPLKSLNYNDKYKYSHIVFGAARELLKVPICQKVENNKLETFVFIVDKYSTLDDCSVVNYNSYELWCNFCFALEEFGEEV